MANLLTSIAGIGGLILSIAAFISMRRMRRAEAQNKEAEGYSTFVDALQKSGKTIGELFEMLAEVPQLKSELRTAQTRIIEYGKDLDWKNRQLEFFIRFGRDMMIGAAANAEYIRRNHNETAPFDPPTKFPTGPLREAT